MERMQKVARVFHTFKEADRADEAAYREMTPDRRVELALFLYDSYYGTGAPQEMLRVSRLLKRPPAWTAAADSVES